MHRAPEIEMKSLDACQVGELVRFSYGDAPLVGLITERLDNPGRVLVTFNDPDYNGWASYGRIQYGNLNVLSYGKRFQISVDEKRFELPPTSLGRAPGLLYLHGVDWQIKAVPERGSQSYGSMHVSLLSGALLPLASINEIAAFPHWSLVRADGMAVPYVHAVIYEPSPPTGNAP